MYKITITQDRKNGLVVRSFVSDENNGMTIDELKDNEEELKDIGFLLQRASQSLKKRQSIPFFERAKDR